MLISLDLFACPLFKEKLNGVTNLRIHIASSKPNPIEVGVKRSIASSSPVSASEKSSEDFSYDESELEQHNKLTKPMAQHLGPS